MSDDKYIERMVASARARRIAGARIALKRLQSNVEYALKSLDNGMNPNIDLQVDAMRTQTALSEWEAINEIVQVYEVTDE